MLLGFVPGVLSGLLIGFILGIMGAAWAEKEKKPEKTCPYVECPGNKK